MGGAVPPYPICCKSTSPRWGEVKGIPIQIRTFAL
jgi:hypothetical protein